MRTRGANAWGLGSACGGRAAGAGDDASRVPRYSRHLGTALAVAWVVFWIAVTWAQTNPAQATQESTAELTEEDVVKMVVAGRPETEILREIRTRERVRFDLSRDMEEELRQAGLPASLLDAMRRRQAETGPEAPDLPPDSETGGEAEAPGDAPRVTVRLIPAKRLADHGEGAPLPAPRPLLYPTVLATDDLAQQHGLGFDRTRWRVEDLAVFLACSTPDHVPHAWRSLSSLGKDFVRAPRHRLLAFEAGAEPAGGAKAAALRAAADKDDDVRVLRLQPPAALEGALETEGPHDLLVGIAVRLIDRWVVLITARTDPITIEAGDARELFAALESRLKRGRVLLRAEFAGDTKAEDTPTD